MPYDRYVHIWLQYWLVILALSLQNIFNCYSEICAPTLHDLHSQLKCSFCICSCISPRSVLENKKPTFGPNGTERIVLTISSGYLRPTNFAFFTKYYNVRPNAEHWVGAVGSMTNIRVYYTGLAGKPAGMFCLRRPVGLRYRRSAHLCVIGRFCGRNCYGLW